MIDSHSIDLLKTDGYLVTPYAALNNDELLASFRAFANTDRAYKQRFMQKEYGYAYDGYSYVGQADSSHQAEDDLVSTFVLSEFFALDRYPAEFQGFLNCGWKTVLGVVRSLELELLTQLDMPALLDFYQTERRPHGLQQLLSSGSGFRHQRSRQYPSLRSPGCLSVYRFPLWHR